MDELYTGVADMAKSFSALRHDKAARLAAGEKPGYDLITLMQMSEDTKDLINRPLAALPLEPIGMGNSFVADCEVHPSMATGHRPWFGTKKPLPENRAQRGTAPQGGIVASANDLARYLQTMMNGHDDVLSTEGKSMMWPATPQDRERDCCAGRTDQRCAQHPDQT